MMCVTRNLEIGFNTQGIDSCWKAEEESDGAAGNISRERKDVTPFVVRGNYRYGAQAL